MSRKRPVREKQQKSTPSAPLRYLLSADRRLRRLSLKKMAERAKQPKPKPKARPRSRGHTAAMGARAAAGPVPATTTSRILAAGGVGVIAAAVLISAGVPSLSRDPGSLVAYESETPRDYAPPTTRPETSAAAGVSVAAPELTSADVAARTPAAAEPAKSNTVPATRAHIPASRPEVQRAAADVPAAAVAAPAPAPAPPKPVVVEPAAARPIVSPEPAEAAAVTLVGCVVFERQTFWLKETDGAEAPRTRSWRSGFLKKRAAPVELVDVPGTLKLASHVGQRVAASGTLVEREMRPRSLQRVAGSCG